MYGLVSRSLLRLGGNEVNNDAAGRYPLRVALPLAELILPSLCFRFVGNELGRPEGCAEPELGTEDDGSCMEEQIRDNLC